VGFGVLVGLCPGLGAIDFLLNYIEYSCNLSVKDLNLVSGDCIRLHYYLQARPRLLVGLLVFIYVVQLAASWLMGIGAVILLERWYRRTVPSSYLSCYMGGSHSIILCCKLNTKVKQ